MYGEIDKTQPFGIPPRKPNGGLYTGESAPANSGYGVVSVVPEAYIYITENLKSANPPPRAMDTIAGGYTRAGNNTAVFPYHVKSKNPTLNLMYVSESKR